jgi:hypothetical protein
MRQPCGAMAWLVPMLVACGSSSSGKVGGVVTGTVAGQAFTYADGTGLAGQLTVNGGSAFEADVALTSWNGACSSFMSESLPPNGALVLIVVASPEAVQPGTFDIGAGATQVQYLSDGAACQTTAQLMATSGTVTYATVSSSLIEATVNAVFSSGEVSGSFSVPVCNVSLSAVASFASMAGTCQ